LQHRGVGLADRGVLLRSRSSLLSSAAGMIARTLALEHGPISGLFTKEIVDPDASDPMPRGRTRVQLQRVL
jgi:hypothetical protein